MSFMRWLSNLFLLVLITSTVFSKSIVQTASQNYQNQQEKDYWEAVDIGFENILNEVNRVSCAETIKMFLGCVVAVETIAEMTGKSYDVVPIEMAMGKTVLASSGRIAVVESATVNIKTQEDLVKLIDSKRRQMKGIFFATSQSFMKNPGLEFENLLISIVKKLPQKLTKKQMGYILSKYLETAVDPHTSLIPREEFLQKNQQEATSFVGIGIEFMPIEVGALVVRVHDKSGAETAGIIAGDIVVKVNDKTVKGMTADQFRKEILDQPNTSVRVEVFRNERTFTLMVMRSKVESKVITERLIKSGDTNIGYIRLENFMYSKACEEIKKHILTFEEQKVSGYVLDLRRNLGGDVTIAQCLAGLFIGKDKVVTYFEERTSKGVRYEPRLSTTEKLTNKPLTVLVDSTSASASEIISGALQDHGRALIVGQKTFGKGSYQGCGPIDKKQTLIMCYTGGLFFLPSGRSNQTTGVIPDVGVYVNMSPRDGELFPLTEANLYLFPLESREMPNTDRSKWKSVPAPTACLANESLVEKYQNAKVTDFYFRDYQLLNAVASVMCLEPI